MPSATAAPPTQVRIAREGAAAWSRYGTAVLARRKRNSNSCSRPSIAAAADRNSAGNGLGLSLVRQIARRHGGDARCAAMEDGRSCFIITLAA